MREHIRQFVACAAQTLPLRCPIYEFGSYQVAGQEDIGNLRPLFPGMTYVGCDVRPGPGVDRLADVSRLALADNSIPTILCLETLEHVLDARRAVDELIRVLAPGGVLFISTPFYFHIHGYPSDYWRMTPACLERLLEPLPTRLIGYQGPATTPHTVYALGIKPPVAFDFASATRRLVREFEQQLQALRRLSWSRRWKHRLRAAFLSKGERRQRNSYFDCHFTVHCPTAEGRIAARQAA
jgi:SAM-dependent methyltransferase